MIIARLTLAVSLASALPAAAQFPPEVTGRVVDRVTRAPVAGATVEVAGGGPLAHADADGGFRLRGLVPGGRELVVRAFGYRPHRLVVEARNGVVERVTVELDPVPAALAPVTVAGDRRDPTPGVTVIERAEIERSRARDLGELLRDVPGVTITRLGGPGAPARIAIRGSGADEVLVLVDGTTVNSPMTGDADLSTVPLESVRRVRVLRGGQSARYGGRALGGVVVVETVVPGEPELMVGVEAGSYGERSAAFRLSSRAGAGAVGGTVTGEWRTADGDFRYAVPDVRGGGHDVRRNAETWQLALGGTGAVVGGATTVRARADGFAAGRGMPGSIVQPSRSAEQDQRRLSGGVAVATQRGAVVVRTDLDVQRQDAAFRDSAPPLGAAYDESGEVTALRATAEVDAHVGGASVSVGAETQRLWFQSTILAAGAPGAQTVAGVWAGARVHRRLGSWVVELHPAVRADWNTLLDDPALSPHVGASLGTGRLTVRVALGAAYSPPSLADQFFQESVLARPNPRLAPERVRGEVEAGVEWRDVRLGPTVLDGELAAFRADVDGMILWFPDHLFVWQPNNFDVRRHGAEATVGLRVPATSAGLRATLTHVSVTYAGPALAGPVIYRPSTTASVSGSATLFTVRMSATARYMGSRRTVAGSGLNTLAPFWIADLRFARQFRVARWGGEAFVGIENLLDHDAFMLVDYPAPGRSWRVGLRIRPWLPPHQRLQSG